MAYTSNPHIGKARRKAVSDVLYHGFTKAFTARKYGVHRSTIGKWLKKASTISRKHIETISSNPHHHANQLPQGAVDRVIALRQETERCAPILHVMLKTEGISISLTSVANILRRNRLTRKKKRPALPCAKIKRPISDKPGALVEMDTIHFIDNQGKRFYIYAVIDTFTRVGYAEYRPFLSQRVSVCVAINALKSFSYPVETIQTDNGGEFGETLYFFLSKRDIKLRHIRAGRPNDNAHIERFIRTIQEECFRSALPDKKTIKQKLLNYISYYNSKRYHLGINCNTPYDFVAKLLN